MACIHTYNQINYVRRLYLKQTHRLRTELPKNDISNPIVWRGRRKIQLHLILAISSSLERDTLLYTVAQLLIILFNFHVVNTDFNLVLEL